MWFLQVDILLLMLACAVVVSAALRVSDKFGVRSKVQNLIPLVDLGVIAYVSVELAVFYALYTVATYGLVRLALFAKGKAGTLVFGVGSLLCMAPLVYSRLAEDFSALPMGPIVLVGIAYNMLKAIDALYYAHYAEQRIPFFTYANYMLFFPVITAGPVFRYRDFEHAWPAPSRVGIDDVTYAVKRMVSGLFMKVVLSSLVASLLQTMVAAEPKAWISLLVPLVSLVVLFFDMAGYASIAIGMGALMGVKVPENFKKPWQAASFTQFWRKWHVTVSDWIREHVFVLVSGKKLTKWHSAALSFVVMVVMSLWHDFSVLFVIDGACLGLLLAAENVLGLTTVPRRANKAYVRARAFVVNYLFAINTMLFTLSTDQIASVLGGLFCL